MRRACPDVPLISRDVFEELQAQRVFRRLVRRSCNLFLSLRPWVAGVLRLRSYVFAGRDLRATLREGAWRGPRDQAREQQEYKATHAMDRLNLPYWRRMRVHAEASAREGPIQSLLKELKENRLFSFLRINSKGKFPNWNKVACHGPIRTATAKSAVAVALHSPARRCGSPKRVRRRVLRQSDG